MEEIQMEKKKQHHTREIFVRIMCFLLGILLTMSAVLIKDRVIQLRIPNDTVAETEEQVVEESVVEEVPEEEEEFENQLDNEKTIGDSHIEVSVLDNYAEEAEAKMEELKASDEEAIKLMDQPVLEADDTVNTTTRVIANMDGKPSKLNWKPFYAAINGTITTSLAQKEQERSSYEETMATNAFDKKVIEESTVDFSGVKISIMGDSLTAASNLNEEEREKYNYPQILSEILGCEVVNLGIGGSSVSSCATTDPMVNRWDEISKDSDIIIVFGGTNDCLFETRAQFGNLDYDYRMNPDTFCGDLDSMLSAMRTTYHENTDDHYIRLIYINPPSTILNDGVVAVDPERFVNQSEFAAAINEIAPNYGFDVIDFYNTNLLNSHDYTINSEFILDGVHGNVAGYQIMAEHIASQIIQMIQQ